MSQQVYGPSLNGSKKKYLRNGEEGSQLRVHRQASGTCPLLLTAMPTPKHRSNSSRASYLLQVADMYSVHRSSPGASTGVSVTPLMPRILLTFRRRPPKLRYQQLSRLLQRQSSAGYPFSARVQPTWLSSTPPPIYTHTTQLCVV